MRFGDSDALDGVLPAGSNWQGISGELKEFARIGLPGRLTRCQLKSRIAKDEVKVACTARRMIPRGSVNTEYYPDHRGGTVLSAMATLAGGLVQGAYIPCAQSGAILTSTRMNAAAYV